VLAGEVAAQLESRGQTAQLARIGLGPETGTAARYLRKGILTGSLLVLHPFASLRLLKALIDSEQPSGSQVLNRWVDWMTTQAILGRNLGDDVALFDEGVLQSLWSMGLEGSYRDPADAILSSHSAWIFPDKVVVVVAPIPDVNARLDARGSRHSRVQSLEVERRTHVMERGLGLIDEILADASRYGLGSEHLIAVQNPKGRPLSETAADVADRILGSGGPARI
jgi:hypothetical protein